MTVGWVTSSPKLASKGDTKAALAMKEENEVLWRHQGCFSVLPQFSTMPVHEPLLQLGPFQANHPHEH